jgi:hypothetical protein
MVMQHNGNFETPDGGYGSEFDLDGTLVNVVTVFTGSGLAADTEICADRPLTEIEQQEIMDLDALIDHALDQIPYTKRKSQHYF